MTRRLVLVGAAVAAGVSFAGDLPFRPSFTMTFGRATDKTPALTVKASEMASCEIVESDGRHVCTWKGHGTCGADFTVVGTFTARDGGWEYGFRYRNCESGMDVEEISFPEITVPRTDGTRLLSPRQTGELRLPKWKELKPGAAVVSRGPMFVGFHFIAALDGQVGGWYVDQRGDARLRACRFVFANGTEPLTLRMETHYIPPATEELRKAGGLPFGGMIRPFRGDWYRAAAFYRDWAGTQDWFRKAKARDFGRLRDIALWMWNRGRSTEVAPQAEKFMADTGLPVGLDWYWWHEIPYDTAYPFFWPPREPVADFRATVARLRAKGAYVQTYTNGMLWDRTDRRWTEDGEREVLRLRDGKPKTQVFNVFTKADTAWMCGNAPVFQKKLREVERELAASGLDGVYMDMIANCGFCDCWAGDHGHPRGGGRAVADGYRRLLEDVKADNPGLQISSEEEGEPFLELVDSLIVLYACYERLGCGVAPEIEYPPVFEAIYHGTVAMYGSYSLIDGVTPWDEKWGTRPPIDEAKWAGRFPDQFACEFARGVVHGIQPCVHKVLMDHLTDPKWATEWKFTTDTARFYHAHREFLFDGEMLDPGRMTCDSAPVDFFIRGCYTKEEKFRTCRQEALPTVFHSVWKAPDGRIAAVVVNRTRQERAYALTTPDIRAEGCLPPLSWKLISNGRNGGTK